MANYTNLKSTINAQIKANGTGAITGPVLNGVLRDMVSALGEAGYLYKGVATPATSPGTPDSNVFYIASTAGTYTNFGGAVVADGEVAILKYNGTWAKEVSGAATAAQVTQLGQEVNGGVGPDTDLSVPLNTGYYYESYNNKLVVTIGATSHYSGTIVDTSTPPSDGIDVTDYIGRTVKLTVPNRMSGGGRLCAIVDDNMNILASVSEGAFVADGDNYSAEMVIPTAAKQLFTSGSSIVTSMTVVVKGELQDGLVQRVAELENDVSSLEGNVSNLEESVENLSDEIDNGKITFVTSPNIHNSAAAVSSDSQPSGPDWQNHGVNGQGEFLNSENYNISYYIPVDAGSSYKSNVPLRHVIFFNISKEVIPNSYVGDTISANTEIVAPAGSAYIILQYGIEYSPDDVKFGLYADDINVDYVDYIPSDSKGEMLITNRTPEYISLLNQKKLNVLLIGSSFGVNTIVQFPALANAGGVNCVCGNLYRGSCSLADVVAIINGTQSFSSGRVYTREHKWASATSNLNEMLALYEWDIIILQRSAPGGDGGSDKWNASMANDLNTIIQYIQAHTTNSPQIMFNSVFGRPIGSLGSRKSELASVDKIMSTAKEMQNEFGIEIIPAATAIQNARNTSLAYVETYNTAGYLYPEMTGSGDHLDTGVGSYVLACLLYEQLLGKRFDLSILNNTFLPTLEDVTNNGCFSDNDFTQITAAQAAIARYAAMCAVRDPMRISNVYSPKITENEGYLINRDGMVRPSTGFAYSSKFYAYAGQKIVVNARGYETNVAILAKVNLEGVDYLPVVVSTDSTYKGYEYAVIESGYYAASFSTSYPRNIIIESDERNDVEKPLLIERVENNVTISSGNNSIRFVLEKNASNKYAGNPVFNFSQYTFNGVTNQNTDDIAPMHALNTTIGANHGQPCVIATINNHGLDNTAIGTGWTKGGVTFYVMRIVDANKVVMMSENRGTMTAPLFVDLTPGDIIRGGATLTVSSTEASQLYPIVKNHSYKMCIDGNEYIYGIKKGDSFEVFESYDIMNPASVLQQIIARAGQSTEPEYNGDVAVRVENTYHFTQNLTVVVITTIIPKQEFAFSDAMFSQAVRIGNNGVVKYYVPNSLPVGGGAYDMRKPLAMTWGDNIPSIFVGRSQMKDPDNHPVNRVMQYDSSIGFALGFLTDRGVGQSLLEFTNNVFELRNNTGKVYPHGVDNKVGPTLLPGNIYSAVMYRALFVPQNSGNRMSMYHFRFDNAEYVYVDYSGSMVDRVEVDDSLNGKKISVIESVNAELKTDVYNSGFYVNATYVNDETCYLIAKIILKNP